MQNKPSLKTAFRLLLGMTFLLVVLSSLGIGLSAPSPSAALEISDGVIDPAKLNDSPQAIRDLQTTHLVYFPLIFHDFCPQWPCLIFSDDFSDQSSGWPHERRWSDKEQDREYIIGYFEGPWNEPEKYFMRIAHTRRVVASPGLHAPTDYIIEVDMQFCDNAYLASAGLVFGASDDLRKFYMFSLAFNNKDHWCAVRKYDLDTGDSPYLRPGGWSSCGANPNYDVNHLKVERVGTSIKTYLNGNLIWEGTDDSYVGELRVGFIHDKYEIGYTGVYFDDFKLWKVHPDSGSATGYSLEKSELEPMILTWDEE